MDPVAMSDNDNLGFMPPYGRFDGLHNDNGSRSTSKVLVGEGKVRITDVGRWTMFISGTFEVDGRIRKGKDDHNVCYPPRSIPGHSVTL